MSFGFKNLKREIFYSLLSSIIFVQILKVLCKNLCIIPDPAYG